MSINQLGLKGVTSKRSVGGSPLPQILGRQTSSSCQRDSRSAKGRMESGMTALVAEAGLGREFLSMSEAKMDQASSQGLRERGSGPAP